MVGSVYMLYACLVVASSTNGAYGSQNIDFENPLELAAALETTIELTIAMEDTSVSTSARRPVCVTYTAHENGPIYRKYQRTEVHLSGRRSPVFSTKVRLPYLLEDHQVLMFEVYHKYFLKTTKYFFKLLGRATCKTADLLSASGRLKLKVIPEKGEKKDSSGGRYAVVLYAEKLKNPDDQVTMTLRSENAEDKEICGGPNHYLEIYKRTELGEEAAKDEDDYIMVHRTQAKDNKRVQKAGETISIPFSTLCGNDRDRELKFVCLNGNNDQIGEFKTTVQEIERYNPSVFTVMNIEKKYFVGEVSISDFSINHVPSFTEFVAAGLQIRLTIAVDFSNRRTPQEDYNSFHYQGAVDNNCEKLLRLVVDAFKPFVRNDEYDVRGFGVPKWNGLKLSRLDDFTISDGAGGIQGILQAYRSTRNNWNMDMAGGANIAPTFHTLVRKIQSHAPSSNTYFVLVVLTAGELVINYQMTEIIERINTVKDLPLSVIFLGMGLVDFSGLDEMLEKKSPRLYRQVSFMTLHKSELASGTELYAYQRTEILTALPHQVALYMNSHGLKPGNETFATDSEVKTDSA